MTHCSSRLNLQTQQPTNSWSTCYLEAKFKPLVSEYGSYASPAVRPNRQIDTNVILKDFPKGAKIVHRRFLKGSVRVDEGKKQDNKLFDFQREEPSESDKEIFVVKSFEGGGEAWEILSVGVPRDEMAFLESA